MRFKIYHAIHPTFSTIEKPSFPHNFSKVAEVEVESLADTFRVTNHIEHDWTTNPEVVWRKGSGANTRSTSVGDVVEDEQGHKFLCEPFGWSELI